MGLLVKAPVGLEAGAPAAQAMGITWYTPPQDIPGGTDEQDLHYMPVYTDIEGLRRYQDVLVAGEDVVFVEKIHGECARVAYRDSRLYVGSRTRVKKRGSGGWWLAAMNGNLEEKLKYFPNLVFYGESHGYTGRYPYGTNKRPAFKCFDIFDPALGRYLDFDDFEAVCKAADIPMAPVLYRGPFSMQTALLHSDGPSTIDPTHTREGVVIRPTKERWHETIGRVILKLHGETFLLKE